MRPRGFLDSLIVYALPAWIIVMLVGILVYWTADAGTAKQSNDCLPEYDEPYFGHGAYACAKSPK